LKSIAAGFRRNPLRSQGMIPFNPALKRIPGPAANASRQIAELKEFLRFPSVSAQPAHAADVRNCARWLAGHLRRVGLPRVELVATPGPPVVYAESLGAPGRPTLLIYGHYDVQPVDPLGEWRTPPFEPAVRDGMIHARGASDDKGPLFAHVK